MSHEQATDLFAVLEPIVSCGENRAGREIRGRPETLVGIGESAPQTICTDIGETQSSRPENHTEDVFPRNLGEVTMYSDPTHQLLHRIAAALERIEQKLDAQPKPKAKPNETLELDDPYFNTWWKLYPRKVGKDKARKAWVKYATTQGKAELLIKDMEVRAKAWEGTTDLRFIPHPSSFLNGKGWLDPVDHAIPKQNQEPKTEQEWLDLAHQKGINTVGLTLPQLKDRVRTS